MKTIRPFPYAAILFFLSLLLFSFQIRAQKPAAAAIENDIQSIRKAFQHINALKTTVQKFNYQSDGCVEDGKVAYHFNQKQVVKIEESGSIGDGSWSRTYYYSAGKVIFCFETLIGGPAVGPVIKTEYRYYFANGQPIRVMENQKIIPVKDKGPEAIRYANQLYKAYATKDFAAALCN